MQGDTITTDKNGQAVEKTAGDAQGGGTPGAVKESAPAVHVYYEVGNELLSKPNALCDVVQSLGCPATAVFCNSPSEADMVDVMLKKRGLPACKLIGHVPYTKVSQSLQQLRQKELIVAVLTDISARDIDLGLFEVVVNYSIHEDPEIYLHRMTAHQSANNPPRVVSLVGPNDFANFHYLKKVVDFKLNKVELPSKAEIAKGEVQKLLAAAAQSQHLADERLAFLAKSILESDLREKAVAMLLNSVLNVMPGLQAGGGEKVQDEERPRGGRGEGGRQDRWEKPRRDRDHDRRRDNGDRYGGERGGGRYRSEGYDEEEGEGGGYAGYDGGDQRPPRREMTPPKRDARLYLGHGAQEGFSESALGDLLKEHCAGAAERTAARPRPDLTQT